MSYVLGLRLRLRRQGVDISYNKHDPDFLRGRVLEFSELKVRRALLLALTPSRPLPAQESLSRTNHAHTLT